MRNKHEYGIMTELCAYLFTISTEINECETSPCLNNGTCKDKINGFNCSCPQNFVGKRCEIGMRKFKANFQSISDNNECEGNPCLNNRTRVVVRNSFNFNFTLANLKSELFRNFDFINLIQYHAGSQH